MDLPLPEMRQMHDVCIEAIVTKLQEAGATAPKRQVTESTSLSESSRNDQHSLRQAQEDESNVNKADVLADCQRPMVGPGFSESLSVASDLTTPTILVPPPEVVTSSTTNNSNKQ